MHSILAYLPTINVFRSLLSRGETRLVPAKLSLSVLRNFRASLLPFIWLIVLFKKILVLTIGVRSGQDAGRLLITPDRSVTDVLTAMTIGIRTSDRS
jgi:hypothetical protein